MQIKLQVLLFLVTLTCVSTSCPKRAMSTLPFVVEYAVWRGWHQLILYTPNIKKDCHHSIVRLVKCLSVNGVGVAWNVKREPRMKKTMAVVILAPRLNNDTTQNVTQLLKHLNNHEINTACYDWLITAHSQDNFENINKILNASAIRFDQNLVVAFPHYQKQFPLPKVCERNFVYKTSSHPIDRRSRRLPVCQNCFKTDNQKNYFRTSERFKNLTRNKSYKFAGRVLPLYRSGLISTNNSRSFHMTNISTFSLGRQFRGWTLVNQIERMLGGIHVIQYFKVRINSTLYASYLGNWEEEHSMSLLEIPYPIESRNFLGEILVAGRRNRSADNGEDAAVSEDGPTALALLDDVLYFITVQLNATSVTRYYSKLGFRTYEGTWTGLLGGLMDQSVDLALEPVTALAPLDRYMDFIFPIAETMCNIYIRQQETSTVRDIFLAPFSVRLLVCVVSVVIVTSLTIVLISKLAPTAKTKDASRPIGYVEALLWSTGILCQQGGSWTPPNPAASVLLIVTLFFAVVTYNAYAAFITSVLSVRVASVDTIAAVLKSPNFKIGYIRNGADQMYLMTTKDAQLNAFYIRGYSDAENLVTSAEEGLARAAKQDYAFFAGQRAARTSLRSVSQARGRCALRELQVPSTRAQLAFPLPLRSPYARSTLVSLLQLRGSGTLDRLERALVPDMPHCARPQGFASARAADVRSALILLVIGLISALVLGIAEYSWKNKKEIRRFSLQLCRRLIQLVSNLF